MNTIFKTASRFLLTVVAISLSGCISLLPKQGPAPSLVALDLQGPASSIKSSHSLRIDEPTGASVYSGNKIVILKTNAAGLSHFSYAQEQEWSERLPKMLQRAVEYHLKSPSWPGIMTDEQSVAPAYTLAMDIRKFQIAMPGMVDVSINVSLYNAQNQSVVTTQTLTYAMPSENSAVAYVKAFDKAMGAFLADLDKLLRSHVK